jgi:hypothetical protein
VRRAVLAVVPLVLALSACGTQTTSEAVHPVSATPASHHVRVGLTEWQVDVAPARALAGRVTLVVTNAGATEHDLVVVSGRHGWSLPTLEPGEQRRLVVHATPGTPLQLTSKMPGQLHHMDATIRVTR